MSLDAVKPALPAYAKDLKLDLGYGIGIGADARDHLSEVAYAVPAPPRP